MRKSVTQDSKIEQKKQRATEIANNMQDDNIEVKKKKLIVNRKIMKFENYWWFISNGFTILCGKSADDNESLLNNVEYLSKLGWKFHKF